MTSQIGRTLIVLALISLPNHPFPAPPKHPTIEMEAVKRPNLLSENAVLADTADVELMISEWILIKRVQPSECVTARTRTWVSRLDNGDPNTGLSKSKCDGTADHACTDHNHLGKSGSPDVRFHDSNINFPYS